MSRLRQCSLLAATTLAGLLSQGRLIRSIRKGAPFIVNLRVQWLHMVRSPERPTPPTIQLLGTVDELISEDDHIDLQSGINFVYRRVPNTNHKDVVEFTDGEGVRLSAFLYALETPTAELESQYRIPARQRVDPAVDQVVFVMHGIRDQGFWPARLERELRQQAESLRVKVEVITSGYGYFPMLPFLFRFRRSRNVRWFMDQYTEALARFPQARMSFVGHSNGTYLLASALETYPVGRFHRAVFAGSVVRRNFPWDRMVNDGRLLELKNYVASGDWVVAWFPAFLERFLNADVGGGGYGGFIDDQGQQHAVTFIKGSHGAAVSPAVFPALAQFVLKGEDRDDPELLVSRQSPIVTALSRFCWLVWLSIAVIVLVVGLEMIPRAASVLAAQHVPYPGVVAVCAYVALLVLLLFSF